MNNQRGRLSPGLALMLAVALAALFVIPSGCGGGKQPLVIAATLDLERSGVLRAWVDDFQGSSGWRVELMIMPDLEALGRARYGECDLTLTHNPAQEERLERSGYTEGRRKVMIGDFVVVGPPDDPAGIRGMEKTTEAFAKIAEGEHPFILRADGSGTSVRIDALWAASGLTSIEDWMILAEEDMQGTLRLASQEGAYTLSDRTTFQRIAGELDLEILQEGDEVLDDFYDVMMVSPATYPDTNTRGAQAFLEYLFTEDARRFLSLGSWELPPQPVEEQDGGGEQ